jgi:acylpyruvate hydrolase
MQFVRFQRYRKVGLGVLDTGGRIVDLSVAAATMLIEEAGDACAEQEAALRLPMDFTSFLAGGRRSLELAASAVAFAKRRGNSGGVDGEPLRYCRSDVRLLSTVNPPLVLASGAIFRDCAEEGGAERTQHREVFLRNPFSILGADDEIPLSPWLGNTVDARPRLGVVIGTRIRCANPEEAAEAIFGFCPLIDLCIRDLYKLSWAGALFHVQYPHACSADGTLVAGPVVSRDRIADPAGLTAVLRLDGVVAYSGCTPAPWSRVTAWIAALSRSVTLEPGTLLIPAGDDEAVISPAADTGRAELANPAAISPSVAGGMRLEVRIDGVGKIGVNASRSTSAHRGD